MTVIDENSMEKKIPNIVIIATGGTLASTAQTRVAEHYHSATVPIETLITLVPELNDIAHCKYEQFMQIFSQNLTIEDWLRLVTHINELLAQEDVDGVVITHGTDTLEETAYFLNLTVKSLKPVVLTGAMRPSNALGADGLRNLYNAVLVASHPNAINKGVLVTLNDTIHHARDVVKTSVYTVDSFKTSELGVLGYIQGEQVYFYRQPIFAHTWQTEFDLQGFTQLPKVHIIYAYVDNDDIMVNALIEAGVAGIVSAGVGRGHQSHKTTSALLKARENGIFVVRSSRVENGLVTRNPEIDDRYDFIAANNLNPQKARILLMLALTVTQDPKKLQSIFDKY
jgi:L-asparaginase